MVTAQALANRILLLPKPREALLARRHPRRLKQLGPALRHLGMRGKWRTESCVRKRFRLRVASQLEPQPRHICRYTHSALNVHVIKDKGQVRVCRDCSYCATPLTERRTDQRQTNTNNTCPPPVHDVPWKTRQTKVVSPTIPRDLVDEGRCSGFREMRRPPHRALYKPTTHEYI